MAEKQVEGSFAAPPPNAPHEVAQPLDGQTLTAHLDRARAHERGLAPLAFTPTPGVPGASVDVQTPKPVVAPEPVQAAPDRSHTPAASNSDSPARGVPKAIADPGKQITGGFGDALQAQYFALDGAELRELILSQMDALAARIANDLRFHIAVTYPRVTARVVIEVAGYADDAGFSIDKVMVPHDKTPIEVARAMGAEEMAFAVVEQRREMAEDGTPENPPDRIRDALGLTKPYKRRIEVPGGTMLVDAVPDLESSF